ncbi:MAG: Ig-like domain-containing protein, partial [Chlorobium sp.]|nr:Ig-like domain-containing protein [Chlorobium sp.]
DAPTLTSFSGTVATTAEDTQATITIANLQSQGDEADVDGTVTAFVVKAVSTGTLKIGADAATATVWNATTNNMIDATHLAYWTPVQNANGSLNAFTVVAKDDAGLESSTPVQAAIIVTPVNDVPTLTSSTPSDNATNVAVFSNIVLSFSEAVQAGSGNIIITADTSSDVRQIAVTDSSQVAINGSTVTLNPTADLQAGNHYHLEMASGVIKDMAGNAYAGISNPATLDFTTNALPTLTTFGAVVDSTYLNTTDEVTYADLAAQGNEADSDGTVTAFIVKSLSTGVLNIGGNIATATAWNATTNNTIDATHHAYWTPATDATGDLNAFTVVAKDNSGVESIIPVQAKVQVKESTALFCDDFSNPLSSTVWDYNHWQPTNNPSYYGRTQQRQSLPEVSDGYLHLKLDTYNPTGYSFFGSEAITKQTFSNANGGIVFEVKAHFENPLVGGIVGGMFLYSPNSGSIHGEIDFETVSNRLNEIQTNIYANEALGAGHPEFDAITGSLTDDHVYRAEWYQDAVLWFVDGKLIREEKTYIPTQPMALHFNIWTPGQEWSEGYNSALNPVNSAAANTSYDFDIDYVCVTQLSSPYYEDDPPVLTSSTPSDDATAVAIGSNIVLTFSEAIALGTGAIEIHSGSATGTSVASLANGTIAASISGNTLTLNPTTDLADGTQYFVTFAAGSVKDLDGNSYAGTTAYDFTTADTTAPTVMTFSPGDAATGVALGSNIVLTFSEAIALGTGAIEIHSGSATGTLVASLANATIAASISGNTLTLNPTTDLADGTQYFVTFAAGSVKDLAGNSYAGTIDYDFMTKHGIQPDPNPDLTGSVTFWKTGASIAGVTSTLTSDPETQLVEFRNIQVAADGSRTIEIWETSPKSDIGSVDLTFTLPDGSVATWQDAAGLPTGWTLLGNTDKLGNFILGGYSQTALSVGPVKLGTLSLTAPTNVQHFELSLSSGQLGNDTVPTFGIASDSMTTGADGLYQHLDMADGTYALTSAKVSGTAESNAIKANDALAALKIAVGMNPNADGSAVSPYQYLAADVNKDGQVKAADALNILKMAVKLSTAPEKEWLFVPESVGSGTMSRTNVIWPDNPIPITLDGDQELDLIGIIKGDVNGSWVA